MLAEKIMAILGLDEDTNGIHARHNLMGALIDLEHGTNDSVCHNTIRRVVGQLAEVERILLKEAA